jgi:hypothetical protein
MDTPPPTLLPWRVELASSAAVGSLTQPLRLRLTFHWGERDGPTTAVLR